MRDPRSYQYQVTLFRPRRKLLGRLVLYEGARIATQLIPGPESDTMLKMILISMGFAFCGYVLGPIDHTATSKIKIRSYSLTNVDFTITSDNPQLTHEIANKILPMRKEIVKKWLPESIPKGMRHITVYVQITSYNLAYCTREDHPHIYIYSSLEGLDETLRHELTHALLMIRYPDLPKWTHEGIASSYDPKGHQKMYRRILAWSRRSGTYPKLAEIMAGVRFNRYNSTAYTTSNSLVKFLLQRRDKYTLFLYATGRCTLERAYGYHSVVELQRDWVKWINQPVEAKKPWIPVSAIKPTVKHRHSRTGSTSFA